MPHSVKAQPMPQMTIPVARPLLPRHELALPYLQKVDANRWYSNYGPLVLELQARLADMFQTGADSVVATSSGTSGLVNTLRALDLPRGSFCLLPAWTFSATPAAVVAAGLMPYFIDVDETSWSATPEIVKLHLERFGGRVKSVVTVAPFGAPVDTAAWDRFTIETGIPVVIDAAAGFDAFTTIAKSRPGHNPVMISMHATKPFGIGEGGMVISTNRKLLRRVREMSNFGFSDARTIDIPGTNGKMSEYAAAFALAALDAWPQTRKSWLSKKQYYAKAFPRLPEGSAIHPWLLEPWVNSTFNIRILNGDTPRIIQYMAEAGVETRQWWGKGCHRQTAYYGFPHAPLPVTEALGESVLALPFMIDIKQQQVEAVIDTLLAALEGTP